SLTPAEAGDKRRGALFQSRQCRSETVQAAGDSGQVGHHRGQSEWQDYSTGLNWSYRLGMVWSRLKPRQGLKPNFIFLSRPDWKSGPDYLQWPKPRLSDKLCDPASANDDVVVVENYCLARSDGPLGLVKCHADFTIADVLDYSRSGLVPVTNLGANPHRFFQFVDADPVHLVRYQSARQQVIVVAYGDSSLLAVDLEHIER